MRTVLAPRAVLTLLLVGALALLGTMVTSSNSDTYDGVNFHPFTMDSCIDWPEEIARNCDPVDLFFSNANWAQVREALEVKGWTTSGLASTQYLHFDSPSTFPPDEQLFLREDLSHRFHMRLWQVPDSSPPVTLGAVHHESGVFSHTVDMAWEDAEAFVAGQLCGPSLSCGTTSPLAEQVRMQSLDTDGDPGKWRGWANDGSATVFSMDPASTATPTPTPTPTPTATPGCEPGIDADGDGFDNDAECYVGTDSNDPCADTNIADDEALPDAWVLDFNDDQRAAMQDAIFAFVTTLQPYGGLNVPVVPGLERVDFNWDGFIDIQDVIYGYVTKLAPEGLNKTCPP